MLKLSTPLILILCVLFSVQVFGQEDSKDVEVIVNDMGYMALLKGSDTITPFVFNQLEQISSSLFTFCSSAEYRGSLQQTIDKNDQDVKLENLETDEVGDGYHIFCGVINSNGRIIGGEGFRMIEFVQRTGENPLFLVQSQKEFEKTESGDYALMNAEGKIITEYYFENVSYNGEVLQGHIVTEKYFQTVELDLNGKTIKVLYHQEK